MDEKLKSETVKTLSDDNLYESISRQGAKISSQQRDERSAFIAQNSHYKLNNDNVSLEYFGADHIFDPSNPQFKNIKGSFQSFLEGKNTSDVVVLVEGSIPAVTQNIEQDIHNTGERGFIAHLAKEKGIEVACHEPDRALEMKYLLEHFQPEQIEYYYYLRGIRDYFRPGRIQSDTSFEDYSAQLLERHKQMFGKMNEFSDFDFSLENMKKIHKNITGEGFDQTKRLDIDPRRTGSVINNISKASSTFRDFYHVKCIEGYLTEGRSVFIVNGRDHAVVQRPALESMFNG